MKVRSFLFSAVMLAAVSFTLSSCNDLVQKFATKAINESVVFEKEDTTKWGSVVERNLDLPAFSSIETKGAVQVVFTQDSVFSVRVRGNEKCIDEYLFTVKNDELKAVVKGFSGTVNGKTPAVTLLIAAPDLNEIEFSGTGRLEMPDSVSLPGSLKVEMAGAGEVCIGDLTLRSLEIEVSGAARCALAKVTTTDDVEIEVNGAGEVKANVFCNELSVELDGAVGAVLSGNCKTFTCEQNGSGVVDTSKLNK